MNCENLQIILIKIIRAALTESELDASVLSEFTDDMLPSLYKDAQRHDVAHIVAKVLDKYHMISDNKMLEKLRRREFLAIYRVQKSKEQLELISNVFNNEKIPFIVLKGMALGVFYPDENMRTSCDIDILVHESDLERAYSKLIEKGYTLKYKGYHDVSLFSPSDVHLELHFNILENMENIDSVLKDAWDYAVPDSEYRYRFSDDFLLYYLIAHMLYHFTQGGCGIKSIMDLWIIKHKMGIDINSAKPLLEKANILTFAQEMNLFSDICFSGNPSSDFHNTLLDYIIKGTVYENEKNKLAIKKNKYGGALKYIFKRIFLPYELMVNIYPNLQKKAFLLPYYWVKRLVCNIQKGTKEIKLTGSIPKQESKNLKLILKRLKI